MSRLITLLIALVLCQCAYSKDVDRIAILDHKTMSKPIDFSFNSEPWFWNLSITGNWRPDNETAERIHKQLFLYFENNGFPEVVGEYPSGYQQYLGIIKDNIKLIYVVHISEPSFTANRNKKNWKTSMFSYEQLDSHSWSALYDTKKNKVVSVFFNSMGIDSGSWPDIRWGKSRTKELTRILKGNE